MKRYYLRALVSINITVEAEHMDEERAEQLLEDAATCLDWNFEDFKPEGTVSACTGMAIFEPYWNECDSDAHDE